MLFQYPRNILMYMGSLLTNIMVSANLSTLQSLDATCNEEIGVPNAFPTCSKHSLVK